MADAKTLILLLLVLHFNSCSSKDTITINQTFKEGDLLISEGQTYALGFFSPGSSSYRYLGIWFHRIPNQTVVWVANRNNPIPDLSGILSINQQGNLVLYSNNNLVWSTNVSVQVNGTLAARILDSGNLILVQDRNKEVLWQSFDYPTNTLLQGMKLGLNRKTRLDRFVTSWRSADDPGIGDYSFKVNQSGSPQIFLRHGTRIRWRTTPWPWKSVSKQFNYTFVDNENEIYHSYFNQDRSISSRMLLDDSGSLKWLAWDESGKRWNEFWSAPKDGCDFYRKCGANGRCGPSMVIDVFECVCLPGYEPKYPSNWRMREGSGGCIRKRLKSSSICGNGEGFIKVESVELPDSSAAVWVDMSMSLVDCEQECKRNCSCTAYASVSMPGNGSGCLAWYGDLIDTKSFMGGLGYDIYVRVDAIELAESGQRSSSFLQMKRMLILSIATAWFVIVIFIIFWIFARKKNRYRTSMKRRQKRMLSNLTNGSNSQEDFVSYDFNTILAATDNFSVANEIGQGGFGTVYKGQLCNGQEIAAKRMSKSSRQGIQEFENEVMLTSKLQHKNLVKLLGCCITRKEQILIYEYLPNKSLDSFLFDDKRRSLLDWPKRLNIISGIAYGMLYLHQHSRITIIHRDLKSSNILLDAEMNPKISDFGMASIFHGDQIQGKTNRVVGTYGYMSPEYAVLGKFSIKSDVFSFGVVLLEVISGKRSSGFNQEDPSLSLIGQVWELWNEDRALEIIDSSLKDCYISGEALRCIQIGLLCVQEDAKDRPTMLQVILMLKSDQPLPSPKQPAFIFTASSCNTRSPDETYSVNEITISDVVVR